MGCVVSLKSIWHSKFKSGAVYLIQEKNQEANFAWARPWLCRGENRRLWNVLSSNLNSLDLVFLRTYQKSLDLLNIFWVSHSEFQLLFGKMKIHPVLPSTPACKSQLTEASGPETWPVTDPAHRAAVSPRREDGLSVIRAENGTWLFGSLLHHIRLFQERASLCSVSLPMRWEHQELNLLQDGGPPFQGPTVGICLTLGNGLSEETRVLREQRALLGRGTRAERGSIREPRRTARPRGLQSRVLW